MAILAEEILDLEAEGPRLESLGAGVSGNEAQDKEGEVWDRALGDRFRRSEEVERRGEDVARQLQGWWRALPLHLKVELGGSELQAISPLPHHLVNLSVSVFRLSRLYGMDSGMRHSGFGWLRGCADEYKSVGTHLYDPLAFPLPQ
jgi:hypothetical protein